MTLGNKTAESQLQAYMWQTESACNPTRTFTPDSVTTYDYDYDNRLITVNLPTNNDTVEYTYDATGRRLTKEYTYHNGANTDVTTYKYHYIGSQITEIEIDAIRNPGATQTVLRNEEVKIHLGANSQPISYEWVKHVGESTTQATYYYHYDIHGNVLKVTDSSENVKITYTYDTLGSILTESNPDSILNFFTFRGASQTIWEPETGLYYSGGYYRPDTGTALQGTGAPVLTNPSSGAMLNSIALATKANAQLAIHALVSATTAGSESGGKPGGFRPPAGLIDGFSKAGKSSPPPVPKASQEIGSGSSGDGLVKQPTTNLTSHQNAWMAMKVTKGPMETIGFIGIGGDKYELTYWDSTGQITERQFWNIMAGRDKDWCLWDSLNDYQKQLIINAELARLKAEGANVRYDKKNQKIVGKDGEGKDIEIDMRSLEWAIFAIDTEDDFKMYLVGYGFSGQDPVFLYAPNNEYKGKGAFVKDNDKYSDVFGDEKGRNGWLWDNKKQGRFEIFAVTEPGKCITVMFCLLMEYDPQTNEPKKLHAFKFTLNGGYFSQHDITFHHLDITGISLNYDMFDDRSRAPIEQSGENEDRPSFFIFRQGNKITYYHGINGEGIIRINGYEFPAAPYRNLTNWLSNDINPEEESVVFP